MCDEGRPHSPGDWSEDEWSYTVTCVHRISGELKGGCKSCMRDKMGYRLGGWELQMEVPPVLPDGDSTGRIGHQREVMGCEVQRTGWNPIRGKR